MSRFTDAIYIQKGACNVSGIIKTLNRANDECNAEGANSRNDPAIRLILHQLAYLCAIDEINHSGREYEALMTACEENSPEHQKRKELFDRLSVTDFEVCKWEPSPFDHSIAFHQVVHELQEEKVGYGISGSITIHNGIVNATCRAARVSNDEWVDVGYGLCGESRQKGRDWLKTLKAKLEAICECYVGVFVTNDPELI